MSDQPTLAVIANDIKHMSVTLTEVKKELREQREANDEWRKQHQNETAEKLDDHRKDFDRRLDGKADVSRVAFLEKIVFGACGLILVAVVTAIIGIVVMKPEGRPPTAPAPATASR